MVMGSGKEQGANARGTGDDWCWAAGGGIGESHGGSLRRGHLQVFGDFYVKLLLDSQNVIEEREVWQRRQVEILIYLHTLV